MKVQSTPLLITLSCVTGQEIGENLLSYHKQSSIPLRNTGEDTGGF